MLTSRRIVERAAVIVATHPADMQSSADLCLANAEHQLVTGFPIAAMHAARRACTYSVGIFHPEYVALCNDIVEILDEMIAEESSRLAVLVTARELGDDACAEAAS